MSGDRIILVILGDTTDFIKWVPKEELSRLIEEEAVCSSLSDAAKTIHSIISDCHLGMFDLEDDKLDLLMENPLFENTDRSCHEYILRDEEPMKKVEHEMSFLPPNYHGQPRSLKETRRSQKKGGRR